MDQIIVSAVILRNDAGQVLTVRKRGTCAWMLPGGKPEAGESPTDAALREVWEELCIELDDTALRCLGTFTAPAANEDDQMVRATVFEHPWVSVTSPRAEIEEIRWADPEIGFPHLAPLLSDAVFPALCDQSQQLRRLTVFTGSAVGNSSVYTQAATAFAQAVVSRQCAIVYGGGHVGLMGVVADAALARGGDVIGVIPQALVDGEIAHQGLTDLEVVPDMHARKNRMAELGDGFVALPGGAGTIEELFEVWTWQQLGIHAKPVALYDVDGFWQPLLAMLDHMIEQGFLAPRFRDSLIVESKPEALLQAMSTWDPPTAKWKAQTASIA